MSCSYFGCAHNDMENDISGNWYLHHIQDNSGKIEQCDIDPEKYWTFHENGEISMYCLGDLNEKEGQVKGLYFYTNAGEVYTVKEKVKTHAGTLCVNEGFLVIKYDVKKNNIDSIYFSRK